jgi:hypothetical protein
MFLESNKLDLNQETHFTIYFGSAIRIYLDLLLGNILETILEIIFRHYYKGTILNSKIRTL